MDRKVIVTISREYGSGGMAVAKVLAKKLGIPYYDKELLSAMSKESGIDEDLYELLNDQIGKFKYYFTTGMTKIVGPSMVLGELALHEKIHKVQINVIQDLAKESCVLLGRCSGYILKDNPDVVRVFISADLESKKERVVLEYGENAEGIEQVLVEVDKQRSNYYNYFTDQVWGKISNYDLVINTSKVGIDQAAEVIKKFIEGRK